MVKPPLRTKSIGFKVSEEEYAQLETAARAGGFTLGQWCAEPWEDVWVVCSQMFLEPAISSWHRGTAHSYAAGSGILAIGSGLTAFAEACRENTEKCKAIDMIWDGSMFIPAIPDPISLLVAKLFELLWRFAAGFVYRIAAGYVSHLVLDATIGKRSIPLLRKSF